MELRDYFETHEGTGVLSTADSAGKVNIAIYSRPHFLGDDDSQLAFIMNDRLSHDNIVSNPQAAFLFIEHGESHVGKRLFLTKTREETDQDKIRSMRRRKKLADRDEPVGTKRFLVHFRVDGVRPLIGTNEQDQTASGG